MEQTVVGSGLTSGGYLFAPALTKLLAGDADEASGAVSEIAGVILNHQVEQGRHGVAVCGPSRGVGVSLVCASLAVALAAMRISVLLVDCNLHEPGLESLITPPAPSGGLLDLLRDESLSVGEFVRQDVIPNLSLLYSGGAAADASELIDSLRCSVVLRECLREYEYTIVDTPPANRCPDARRIAGAVGYALIVARRDLTYVDDVSMLAQELAQDGAAVIGTLMNRPSPRRQ